MIDLFSPRELSFPSLALARFCFFQSLSFIRLYASDNSPATTDVVRLVSAPPFSPHPPDRPHCHG